MTAELEIKIKQFPIHYRGTEDGPEYNGLPQYKTAGAAGFDLIANESAIVFPMETKVVRCGIGVELPPDFELQVRGRSGMSKAGLLVHLGTVDSDYRGEIGVIITNLTSLETVVNIGDRIAQAVINRVEHPQFCVSAELSITERGDRGYGSTGTN